MHTARNTSRPGGLHQAPPLGPGPPPPGPGTPPGPDPPQSPVWTEWQTRVKT